MNRFLKQLKSVSRSVRLEKEQKAVIRENLMAFMRTHEVVPDTSIRLVSAQYMFMRRYVWSAPVMAAILIIALGGLGMSAAAQSSVPGQLLYPVKIQVREKVETFLALSPKALAEVESEHAQERLQEATELAAAGHLKSDVAADLENRFEGHVRSVNAQLVQLEANGNTHAAEEVSSGLEASLRAHKDVFAKIQSQSGFNVQVVPLQLQVLSALDDVNKVHKVLEIKAAQEANAQKDNQAMARRKIDTAQRMIVSTQFFLERKKLKLGAQATVKAERQLKIARELAAEAEVRFKAGNFRDSFVFSSKARKATEESRALIDTQSRLNDETGVSFSTAAPDNDDDGDKKGQTNGAVLGVQASSTGSTSINVGPDLHLKQRLDL